MNQKNVYIGIAALCFCLRSGAAFSGDVGDSAKDRAEKYFKAGLSLLETDNYLVAAQEFESSVKLYPTKSGYFNLATCYFELRRYNEAIENINRLKREFKDELDEQWKNEISSFEEKLKTSVVAVEFSTNIDGATISLDGKKVESASQTAPLLVDPGDHKVTISAPDFDTITETVKIRAGQGKTVYNFLAVNEKSSGIKSGQGKGKGKEQEAAVQDTRYPVQFENKEKKKNKGKRKPRIGTAIAFSIGGATGLAAITTGVIHLVGVSNIRDQAKCTNDNCEYDEGQSNQLEKMKKLGLATNILISVSAVAIVTGTILAFVEGRSSRNEKKSSINPVIWDNGGGLMFSRSF